MNGLNVLLQIERRNELVRIEGQCKIEDCGEKQNFKTPKNEKMQVYARGIHYLAFCKYGHEEEPEDKRKKVPCDEIWLHILHDRIPGSEKYSYAKDSDSIQCYKREHFKAKVHSIGERQPW